MHSASCVRCKKSTYRPMKKQTRSEVKTAWLKEYCEAIHVDTNKYKFICGPCRLKLYKIRKDGNLQHDINTIKKASHHQPEDNVEKPVHAEEEQAKEQRQTRGMALRKRSRSDDQNEN